jgi:hypothetical protein
MKKIAKVPEQNAREFLAFLMALLLLAVFCGELFMPCVGEMDERPANGFANAPELAQRWSASGT